MKDGWLPEEVAAACSPLERTSVDILGPRHFPARMPPMSTQNGRGFLNSKGLEAGHCAADCRPPKLRTPAGWAAPTVQHAVSYYIRAGQLREFVSRLGKSIPAY